MEETSYLVVAPAKVVVCRTQKDAIRTAARIDRAAKAAHGPRAGADCYVVLECDGRMRYLGLVCGDELIGETFGVSESVISRARDALVNGTAVSARRASDA